MATLVHAQEDIRTRDTRIIDAVEKKYTDFKIQSVFSHSRRLRKQYEAEAPRTRKAIQAYVKLALRFNDIEARTESLYGKRRAYAQSRLRKKAVRIGQKINAARVELDKLSVSAFRVELWTTEAISEHTRA